MSRLFTVIEAEQRSQEWRKARAGLMTGSRASDMLATVRSGEAAARRDLRLQLALERVTGEPQDDTYVNFDMKRGIELEADACLAYEAQTGVLVERTGFLRHVDLPIGCSLDGHLGDVETLVEFKVPKSATHLRYLRSGGVPPEHLPQIQHNLLVTGALACDFVSWDPRFPGRLQLYIARITREQAGLPEYERALLTFLAEVQQEERSLLTMAYLPNVLAEAVSQ